MAAGTWKLYTRFKRYLGTGTIVLNSGVIKMVLLRASASANILKVSNAGVSVYASVPGEISATGGYATGGRTLPGFKWTAGSSSKAMKFTYSTAGLVFTASGAALNNIKYALLRNSTGAGAGKLIGYVTLSTAGFTIASGNTVTVLPATNGVFQLA